MSEAKRGESWTIVAREAARSAYSPAGLVVTPLGLYSILSSFPGALLDAVAIQVVQRVIRDHEDRWPEDEVAFTSRAAVRAMTPGPPVVPGGPSAATVLRPGTW